MRPEIEIGIEGLKAIPEVIEIIAKTAWIMVARTSANNLEAIGKILRDPRAIVINAHSTLEQRAQCPTPGVLTESAKEKAKRSKTAAGAILLGNLFRIR